MLYPLSYEGGAWLNPRWKPCCNERCNPRCNHDHGPANVDRLLDPGGKPAPGYGREERAAEELGLDLLAQPHERSPAMSVPRADRAVGLDR
ncbi:hypothetical protein GCM10009858_09210 [Terrabacter carboxydivorans]|uniref:HNH endonuclease n=1 Tax=Terrabacter carboxydivorans TaxID=619730 RepID=A0ABN3KXK1_9MICO